ncbi:hypothetical protein GCN74_28545, partial [Janthinobacterium sp. FT14W]
SSCRGTTSSRSTLPKQHAASQRCDAIIGPIEYPFKTVVAGRLLPREEGYGLIPRTKNGPALAGYGAVTMANALKNTVTDMPTLL